MTIKHMTFMVAPVFKNNLGIHFTKAPLQGVDNNAWYELGPEGTPLLPKIQSLLIGANLAEEIVDIEQRNSTDYIVSYRPMPENFHSTLTPKGWEIVEKPPLTEEQLLEPFMVMSDEDKSLLLENTDLLSLLLRDYDSEGFAKLLVNQGLENAKNEFFGYPETLEMALKHTTLKAEEIAPLLCEHLNIAEILSSPEKDLQAELASLGYEWVKEQFDISTEDLIEEIKSRYHKHDLVAKDFILSLEQKQRTALLISA